MEYAAAVEAQGSIVGDLHAWRLVSFWLFPGSFHARHWNLLTVGSVIFASIWRAATMKDLSHIDASWANVDPCLWSIVENGIGKLLLVHANCPVVM